VVCREFYIAGRRRGTKSGNAGIGRGKHSRRVSGKSDTSETPLEGGGGGEEGSLWWASE
jgi:hypothetical protein